MQGPAATLLVKASGAALLSGLILGNHHLILLGLVPMSVALLGLSVAPPQGPVVRLVVSSPKIVEGTRVAFRMQGQVPEGSGVVIARFELPAVANIVRGSNFAVFSKKENEALNIAHDCEVEFPKRGLYEIPPLRLTLIDGGLLRRSESLDAGATVTLEVVAKPVAVRGFRSAPQRGAQAGPDEDKTPGGQERNSFRQIRPYRIGDPLRKVNWKATARAQSLGKNELLVNEYEPEGQRAVLVILDATSRMDVGGPIKTRFDRAADAAYELCLHFNSRGHPVGLLAFGPKGAPSLPIRPGGQNLLAIRRAVFTMKAGDDGETLDSRLEKRKRELLAKSPMVVVVSRVDAQFTPLRATLLEFRRRMRVLRGSTPPVAVLDVDSKEDADTTPLLALERQAEIKETRRATLPVIRWNDASKRLRVPIKGASR